MTVAAILFDMDGVVVDSMRFHADAWKRVFGEYGIVLDDVDVFRREGMSGRESIEEIFLEKQLPVPSDADFHDLLSRKHALFEQCTITVFPLIESILEWTAERGIATALVTGSLKRSVIHVMPRDILSRFHAVITADDVTRGKPDPEPFRVAIKRLGVAPEQSRIIENSPMGIRSAKSAGIVCYAIETTLPRPYLMEADRIFSDHGELLEFLQIHVR